MNGSHLRIVSLLPSATEIVAALGKLDQLVAVSHACDRPREVRNRPVVTKSIVPEGLPQAAIDEMVSQALREGRSLYELDEALLAELEPDVVLTQELCDVCAVNHETVVRALSRLSRPPQLLSLEPGCIEDILRDLLRVGAALQENEEAERLVEHARLRMDALRRQVSGARRPSVVALEWFDPLFFGGHWVPEQIDLGGGKNVLGKPRERSARFGMETLRTLDPEVILLMPCGYGLDETKSLAKEFSRNPVWPRLRAVQEGQVYALDANACFSRPSLRVIDGAEALGHILHPRLVAPPPNRIHERLHAPCAS